MEFIIYTACGVALKWFIDKLNEIRKEKKIKGKSGEMLECDGCSFKKLFEDV